MREALHWFSANRKKTAFPLKRRAFRLLRASLYIGFRLTEKNPPFPLKRRAFRLLRASLYIGFRLTEKNPPSLLKRRAFRLLRTCINCGLRLAETSVVVLLACGNFEFLYDKGVVLPFICQKLIELYIVLFIYYVVY